MKIRPRTFLVGTEGSLTDILTRCPFERQLVLRLPDVDSNILKPPSVRFKLCLVVLLHHFPNMGRVRVKPSELALEYTPIGRIKTAQENTYMAVSFSST